MKQGLPQSQVQTILQDQKGYLWIGTADGLARFDGNSFYNLNKKDGLGSNYIDAGLIDSSGIIWISHRTEGISKINSQNFEIEVINDPSEIATAKINDMYQDSSGIYWFATATKGVFKFDGLDWKQVQKSDGLISNCVNAMCEQKNGYMWFATDKGISLFKRSGSEIEPILSASRKDGLPANRISCIISGRDGNIWLGTNKNGICRVRITGLDISEWRFTHFTINDGLSSNQIRTLHEDEAGRLWIGTKDKGITIFEPSSSVADPGKFSTLRTRHGLSYHDITTIFQDREGLFWIGTNGGGICQYRSKRFELFGKPEGFYNDAVWAIYEDSQGNYWFGTENGLSSYKPSEQRGEHLNITNYTSKDGLLGREVDAIYEDAQGILWLSVYDKGVQRFDPVTKKFMTFNDIQDKQILCITSDSSGMLWFGSNGGGIYRYDPVSSQVENFNVNHGLPSNDVFALLFSDDGKLWIATRHGSVVTYDGNIFHKFSRSEGFQAVTALSLTKDLDGNVWIGTEGHGIYKYDGTQFTNYYTQQGFTGDDVYSLICDDDNNIWQGTRRGIEKYNILTGEIKQYDQSEGFHAVETNQNAVYKDSKGNLWFGTIDGAIKYNPLEDITNSVEPLIYLDKLSVFLGTYPVPADGKFAYHQNHLTFNFTALSFIAPEKIRYQYKLEGLDTEWFPETSENYARYANLDPGKYLFKVRAKNNDGNWSKAPAVYSFEILSPFWRTSWFFFLIALFTSFTIYGAHRRHVRHIQKDNIRLEAKVEARTRQLVTEKEKAQKAYEAMRESEERYRKLIEMSPDAIIVHSEDTIEYVNNAGMKLFGAEKKKDIIGRKIFDLAHPDFIEVARKRIRQLYKEKKKVKLMEQKMLRLDGSPFDIEVLGAPITYMGKDAAQTVIRDITERKQAELDLIQEKERLAVTLSSIYDGVITTDIDGRIILMNERAQNITGWTQGQSIGKNFSRVVQIFQEEQKFDPVKQVVSMGIVLNFDNNTILTTKKGNKLNIQFSAAPIQNSDGETIGVVSAFRDITDKKKMEFELLKAQKLESIGILAGGIAHDFNNILTAILGNISLAKLYTDQDKVILTLTKAERASLQAKELTQQLLTFSKGGAPVKETASIFEIVKESANFILRGSNLKCKFINPPDLWAVDVDPGQMSQVVQNLIINAQQAMPEGNKIFISLENMNLKEGQVLPLSPGRYVKITIRDQGVGIPDKYLPKIFDPYFTTKKKGSGLGLATTYSIIKRHEGNISITSKVGEGTTVEIYLPASVRLVSKNNMREELMHNGKGRILVMDDEEMVLDLIKQTLDHLGYEAHCVEEGGKAIEEFKKAKIQNRPFDVVIMDLTIPGGMGGKEVIKTLKKIDPEVKAIVSSGYSNDPIMSNYKKYGFAARLSKPYQIETLSTTLQKLIR